VRAIGFEGNGKRFSPTSDYAVRSAMEQAASQRVLGLLPPGGQIELDLEVLRLDAWRIETWYAHHGYFDARVLGWDLRTVRPERAGRPGCERRREARRLQAVGGQKRGRLAATCGARTRVVDVVGLVEEGPASLVEDIEWIGLEVVGAPIRSLLARQAALQEGAVFTLAALNATEDLVHARLGEQSFARATVRSQVDVHPEDRSVRVQLIAEPGPACTFGEVRLTGEVGLSPELIGDAIRIEAGQPWKTSLLGDTQRALFALGVYSVVDVVAETGAKGDDVVPVRIELRQSLARQLRVGGGVEVETGRQEVRSSASFSHVNFLGRLWRPQLSLMGGYASVTPLADLADPAIPLEGGPVADADLSLTIPRFPGPAWQQRTAVGLELGVEEGYRFFEPSFQPGLTWRARRGLSFGFDYRLANFQLIGESTIDPAQLEFKDGYLLSSLGQSVTLDRRDDLIFPRKGTWWSATLTEAGGPVGGSYNFLRATADSRGYVPIHRLVGFLPPTTLAGRVGAGAIEPYGAADKAAVPIDERLFLGGSNTVRGWTRNHLGPFACNADLSEVLALQDAIDGTTTADDCLSAWGEAPPTIPAVPDGSGLLPAYEPVGGLYSLHGSVELRTYTDAGYGAVLFLDAGMVWPDRASLDLRQLQSSVGTGLRYKSPIGPVRLDVAWRLGDPAMFSQERRFGVHFALAEAF
jgi:outer membrane protein assembly factor BamA